MAALTSIILATLGVKRAPPKRKRGRPSKRIRFPKVGEGSGSLLSLEGWSYDRKGNPVAPADRLKRGQRKRIPRKYHPQDLQRISDDVEARRTAGTKKLSFRKALFEYMVEVYISDVAPKPDPKVELYRKERARARGEAMVDPALLKEARAAATREFDRVRTLLLNAQKLPKLRSR